MELEQEEQDEWNSILHTASKELIKCLLKAHHKNLIKTEEENSKKLYNLMSMCSKKEIDNFRQDLSQHVSNMESKLHEGKEKKLDRDRAMKQNQTIQRSEKVTERENHSKTLPTMLMNHIKTKLMQGKEKKKKESTPYQQQKNNRKTIGRGNLTSNTCETLSKPEKSSE